jgi:hypothetical protein
MKLLFAAIFIVASIVGSTSSWAAQGSDRGVMHGSGIARGTSGIGPGAPIRQAPNMQGRIPAPLPPPSQAPVINGPLNSNGLPPMGSSAIGQ